MKTLLTLFTCLLALTAGRRTVSPVSSLAHMEPTCPPARPCSRGGRCHEPTCNRRGRCWCSSSTTEGAKTTMALIISGGEGSDNASYTVEAFVPATGEHCQLPSIPANPNRQFGPRSGHSMEGLKICSGGPDHGRANCISLTDGTWNLANSLVINRMFHSSWVSPSGRRLLGSFFSWDTTEILREDGSGTSDSGFSLRYNSFQACPINLGKTVILTGGATYYDYKPTPRVVEYNEEGYLRDLPQLQVQRRDHGCGYYVNQDGSKTFLVTGGNGAIGQTLSSTELLVENGSTWALTGELPSPRTGLRGAIINNKILMTGGSDDETVATDEILEFDPQGQWRQMDRMIQPRSAHAASVIQYDGELWNSFQCVHQ